MNDFQHQYDILKELHGENISDADIIKIIATDIYAKIKNKSETKHDKYGLIIMRAQPFHYGHQHIINEVLLDDKIPLIILGESFGLNLDKNPLSVKHRKELIKLVYPNIDIKIDWVGDNSDWDKWWNNMISTITKSKRNIEDITLYYYNKPEDKYDYFECQGKEYYNEFYTKIFEDQGICTKAIEFVNRDDIKIDAHATNIRKDLEKYKHLLDARVYRKLKEYGW